MDLRKNFVYRVLHSTGLKAILLLTGAALISRGAADEKLSTALMLDANTPWVVEANQPEPIQRALKDLERDWYKVFGRRPSVVKERPEGWKGPLIYLGHVGSWRDQLVREPFEGAESFLLREQRDAAGGPALVATGADIRGSIYAAYALAEELLGVDPWYFWVDKEPIARERIEVPEGFNRRFGPPTFKYRGWFINDEDLLAGFSPDPLRENVFSLDMADRIYETLLRLRGNMVVPATFPFPDERCQELAARRGLILNMHHCLVLGVNMYRWPDEVPFSFNKHPEILERYWQASINAYKDYEVVWSVAYRGKSDHPFWFDDPELKTPAERGQVITNAIARQVEMVRKLHPDAPIIANMWAEGADLLHQGLIKLPQGVTIVWPDGGNGIIRDQGRVQPGQGIYYHTAMMSGAHNQLTEMVNPGRICNQIGRFARAGATSFLLVNVSDVRPVPLSTDCVMKLAWDAKPYLQESDENNMTTLLEDWSRRQFGAEAGPQVAGIYREYFATPFMDDTGLKGEHWHHRCLRRLVGKANPLIKAAKPLDDEVRGFCEEMMTYSNVNRASMEQLAEKAMRLLPLIPADRKDFYQSHVLTQIQIHLQSLMALEATCQAVDAYGAGDRAQAIAHAAGAIAACDRIPVVLRKAEYGKWAAWYAGERFIDLDRTRLTLQDLRAAFKGEPESLKPERWKDYGLDPVHHYDDMYQYQEPFLKNYPLLYPPKEHPAR
jgi:Glycosyl hydrolase family 115